MVEDNDTLSPQASSTETSGNASLAAEPAGPGSRPRPQVTFMGNSYDLTAVIAVATGGTVAFSCLTCNMGFYCLPIVPIVLGLIGLLSAEESADPDRTRMLSWIGIGSGGLVFLLMVLAIVLYVAFIIILAAIGVAAEAR